MDESIKPVDDQDIILWPNGHWDYRNNVDPIWLEDATSYEVVHFDSQRWHIIQEA